MMRPSPAGLPATRDFGTAYPVWVGKIESSSITLQRPVGRQFYVLVQAAGTTAYWYVPGVNQQADRAAMMIAQGHNGSNGSVAISLLWPLPGRTFPASIDLSMGSSSYPTIIAILMQPRGDFRKRSQGYRVATGASGLSFTVTPPSGLMRRPGGLWIAAGWHEQYDPSVVSAGGNGWEGYAIGHLGVGLFVPPTGSIITPPPVTFTSSQSAIWVGVSAAVR